MTVQAANLACGCFGDKRPEGTRQRGIIPDKPIWPDPSGNLIRSAKLPDTFTRQQALAAGLKPRDLRAANIKLVMRGVYTIAPDPDDGWVRAQAALLKAGKDAVICGVTALRLMGVDLPFGLAFDTRIHLWLPKTSPRPRARGVRTWRGRRLGPNIIVNGVPMAHPGECWLQLGSELSVEDLVIIADALTRRQHPVTKLSVLASMIPQNWPGGHRCTQAIGLAREGTDSVMETVIRLMLVRAGLPCPEVNVKVIMPDGSYYFFDMSYQELKTAIEFNGANHVGDRAKMERDEYRRRRLQGLGWSIVTVTMADVTLRPSSIIRSVLDAMGRSV